MGGSITVKSLPGTGSRFIVRINTGHENTRLVHSEGEIFSCEYEPQDPLALTPLQGKVLLADDNADNQQLISYFVEKMGPRVVLAHNGQIALDLVSNCDFDLVLMDIQMPVMNGIDAVRKIREKGKQLPIIALTANASNEDREACLAVGCNDFLTKPVDRHKLYEVLSEYLGKKSSGQAKNLYSTVLDEEPELSDLVEKYCHRLPGLVEQFKQSLHEGDMSGLQKMSHDLKGTGGGMGFPALTDIAAAIESRLREQDVENLGVLIEELENIVHRIIQGMVESKAAGRNGKPDASHDAA
jgi:CheY-like chemotaxis protein/HPt (histidine-containing phosphotransfer) domain-containing protein